MAFYVVIGAIISLFLWLFRAMNHRLGRRIYQPWEDWAARYSLEYRRNFFGHPIIYGNYYGHWMRLEVVSKAGFSNPLNVKFELDNSRNLRFKLKTGLWASLTRPYSEGIAIGVKQFDRLVHLTGKPDSQIADLFITPAIRDSCLTILHSQGGFSVELKGNSLRYEANSFDRSPKKVQELLDVINRLTEEIEKV